jgi:hypothetical protein
MNINISKEEYRVLLDMLSVADWVIHAYAVKKEDYHHEHEVLKNKLLSYSKEMGADDLIESSEEVSGFFETTDYETFILNTYIQPYENELFWDELIERLAERDLIKSVGKEQYTKMEILERMKQIDEMKKPYESEFESRGIENLKVNNSNS